jgi:glutamyl-tRNA reductase
VLTYLHTIAFTHRKFDLTKIGMLHIELNDQATRLKSVKSALDLDEFLFLSTCNRVEISFICKKQVDSIFFSKLLKALYPNLSETELIHYVSNLEHYHNRVAIQHALAVASSIDSMIIGEREIITQVRNAYEHCSTNGLTGDSMRILMKHVIETAKKVYTQTSIATKPVSVVSLAYQQLKKLNIALDARIILIGAGATNTTMSHFLKKHGYKNFVVFNRTLAKAELLADALKGTGLALSEIHNYTGGFDVIITCTGADHHLISLDIYEQLLQGETSKKAIIDIAIPQDLDPQIGEKYKLTHVSVEFLQQISNQNLKERSKEIDHVQRILTAASEAFELRIKERQVEIAMKAVPKQVKDIKTAALNDVFKDEIENMDAASRAILEKVIGYMEKKYISGPMKLAKEILLKND